MASPTIDELITQVSQARSEVADAMDQTQGRLNQIDQLDHETGLRLGKMSEFYLELNQHIAAQSQRIVAASATLMNVIGQNEAALNKFDISQSTRFGMLDSRFADLEQNHDAATTAFAQHGALLDARESSIGQVADQITTSSASLTANFQATLDQFGTKLDGWMDQTSVRVGNHSNRLENDLAALAETKFNSFSANLVAALQRTQLTVQNLESQTKLSVNNQAQDLQNQLRQLQDQIGQTIEALTGAIQKLENTATKVAKTLTEGSEAASAAMKVSNIGLDQVFDFIRNLEKLCDEVIDAAA